MIGIKPPNLETTELFKSLHLQARKEGAEAEALATNTLIIADEAVARLRRFPAIHGEFTLHDDVHSLRVVELMGCALGPMMSELNSVELSLLILSAYHHDQGMIPDKEDLKNIRASEEWRLHEAQWSVDHPNRQQLLEQLGISTFVRSDRERVVRAVSELDAAMLTDFIRKGHGERSARFVVENYGTDKRLSFAGRPLAELLAPLCKSHVMPSDWINSENGLRLDELVGKVRVNTALLAYVLRLADILDFDRARTPDSLYRTINFSSDVSLFEWEKHRSVTGWEISSQRVIFSAHCEHPAYERAIRQFFDVIDGELNAAHAWFRSLPADHSRYQMRLPEKVDRSRVGPRRDSVTGLPKYRYHNLEFSLARDELVKLLMTGNLYSQANLFVRELLQNSMDALRHRQSLYTAGGNTPPTMHVAFKHFQDDGGFDVVECWDNGVGMSEHIICHFLTTAGRSYYRSPEFEAERARFRSQGCDFDPCARFGIGFMSCFMFGDDITLQTRRDNGPGSGYGEPLVVEITGVSGLVVIRPGKPDQPIGTTVRIRGRERSFIADAWEDPVNLVEVLEGYALATEFPIKAECCVSELERETSIPIAVCARPDPIESLATHKKRVFRVDLSTVDANLRGEIRICTLTDESGCVATENDEALLQARPDRPGSNQGPLWLVARDGTKIDVETQLYRAQVCCDGILVAGSPGRAGRYPRLATHHAQHDFGGASFLIDARGSLKPDLTPARTPPHSFAPDPTWCRLFRAADKGYGQVLQQIVQKSRPSGDPVGFWRSVNAYDLRIDLMPLDLAWDNLMLPFQSPRTELAWRAFRDVSVGSLLLSPSVPSDGRDPCWSLGFQGEAKLEIPQCVLELARPNRSSLSERMLELMLLATGCLESDSPLHFSVRFSRPKSEKPLSGYLLRSGITRALLVAFAGSDPKIIRIAGPGPVILANSLNPVAKCMAKFQDEREVETPLFQLLQSLFWGWPLTTSGGEILAKSWSARFRLRLGQLSRAIDWPSVPEELRPPYSSFIPGIGVDHITADHLQNWGASRDRTA